MLKIQDWYGVPYEMWGEVPLQRERLLGMTQKAINNKKTKVNYAYEIKC